MVGALNSAARRYCFIFRIGEVFAARQSSTKRMWSAFNFFSRLSRQRTIGQDINPTALIARVRDAGAKWVELRSPARSAVTKSQVPKLTTQNVVYGGPEDD